MLNQVVFYALLFLIFKSEFCSRRGKMPEKLIS